MKLEPFELERMQSEWEHQVDINLTESGVQPLSIMDLVPDASERTKLLEAPLGYVQTNGSVELRGIIANLYNSDDPEQVVVTNGGAEANFLCTWSLLHEQPGSDEFVIMLPNYMQIHGIVRALGKKAKPFYLKQEKDSWVPDIEGLKEVVSKKTAAIAICNPNNPTGAILDRHCLQAIADIAADAEVWVLSDEIYQGAEQGGNQSESFYALHDKVLITNSLSKAYGLPGLRLGWIASNVPGFSNTLWAYSDYTTICPTKLSDRLARAALQPEMRSKILERTRRIVGEHWATLKDWLDERADIFSYVPPRAAAICFIHHRLPISSMDLVMRLLKERSLLLVPGEHFGMPEYLRIGFGYSADKLREGLRRFDEIIKDVS
ncbi:MAG: aminotransferase class I/II-fold pyridoxal phosphate-dependent enzyme [Promethearchaeota archaeon]